MGRLVTGIRPGQAVVFQLPSGSSRYGSCRRCFLPCSDCTASFVSMCRVGICPRTFAPRLDRKGCCRQEPGRCNPYHLLAERGPTSIFNRRIMSKTGPKEPRRGVFSSEMGSIAHGLPRLRNEMPCCHAMPAKLLGSQTVGERR